MKVAILTLRLHINYGGVLQAYALMEILRRMGHEPWLISNQPFTERARFFDFLHWIKKAFRKVLLGEKKLEVFKDRRIRKEYQTIYKPVFRFINERMKPATSIICTDKEWNQLQAKYGFDAYIVGSDQVWRLAYADPIERYFFSFLENEKKVRRLAYAASFGIDEWEFSKGQTEACSRLLKQFNAVSVREDSAIALCKKYLDCNAVHLLDPTMLLTSEDYSRLLHNNGKAIDDKKGILIYLLDVAPWKQQRVSELEQFYSLPSFWVNNVNAEDQGRSDEERKVPSVESWLEGFASAQCVITDSFHASVFSILFHKPFWVCGNDERGLARLKSLLSMFGLEDRLLVREDAAIDYGEPIDWANVDRVLAEMRKKSLDFLKANL